MRLLTISTGKVMPLFGNHHPDYKSVASAIRKKAVSTLDNPVTVKIATLGIEGDEQADLSVHGGIEKAIYVYPAEHYAFWNELLTRETKQSIHLEHGSIGENFTIEGLLETEVFVGDRLRIGELECAAIGVPNKDTGEAVKVFVVRKDPNLTEEDVEAYCRREFTNYKRPKFIVFKDELPKTNVGKILRRELRNL